MDKCRIILFSEEWRDPLMDYLRKTFPSKSDDYISYCVDHSSGPNPSIIVIDENNKIVGCHLLYCTQAFLQDKEIETQWGHDTYLDEEFRSEIGVEFVLYTNRFHGFGMGLSAINHELHKKLKTSFHEGVYSYYSLTNKIFVSPFQKLFHAKPIFRPKSSITVNNYRFRLCNGVEDIRIPNKGYWYQDKLDVDFVRNEQFLNQRFFKNKVFEYFVYALDSPKEPCYFVVRRTLFHGCPAITISDFRYSLNNPGLTSIIYKAVKRLAESSNFGIVVFYCGDVNMNKTMSRRIHYKIPVDFITGRKESIVKTFSITGADSDADFNRN